MQRNWIILFTLVGFGGLSRCGPSSPTEAQPQHSTAAATPGEPTPASSAPSWNVILITIDTLRADHLGCYGYPRETSPSLDRFAAASIRFEQAVVQWPKTTPSFASMLTSTYPHTNGVIRSSRIAVDSEFPLLAERLKAAGYATGAAVSNPNLDRQFGFDRGFDHYQEVWKDEKMTIDSLPGPECDAKKLTFRALEVLDQLPSDEKLFLWAHYIDPHTPYDPAEPYREMFVGDEYYDESRRAEFIGEKELERRPNWAIGGINPRLTPRLTIEDEKRTDYYVAEYDAEIRTVDEQIEVLLGELRKRGLWDNSIIVFTSDHGESLGEHNYYFEHGRFPYDTCARVPLWIRYPGMGNPRVIEEVTPLLGMVPTLLDLAGVKDQAGMQGISWRPLLERQVEPAEFVYMESGYTHNYQWTVRDDRYKLCYIPANADRRFLTGSEWELYDTLEDPGELHNLAESNPELLEKLKTNLLAFVDQAKNRSRKQGEVHENFDPATEEQLRALGYLGDQ